MVNMSNKVIVKKHWNLVRTESLEKLIFNVNIRIRKQSFIANEMLINIEIILNVIINGSKIKQFFDNLMI